ncbi:MAG TPA: hypothetical protein VGE74_30015 [Gemmata sp.]
MPIEVTDLTAIARAADPAVSGLAVLRPDREAEPGWVVAALGDGTRVRIDGVTEDSPAIAAVAGADLGVGAVADRALAVARTEARDTLATRADLTGIQVRTVVDAVCTLANDEFEALGRGRPLTADKLFGYIAVNPTSGDPLPPT